MHMPNSKHMEVLLICGLEISYPSSKESCKEHTLLQKKPGRIDTG